MNTLIEILRKTETFFVSKGLESPRLDAELIVGAALGLKRLDLYLQHDRLLSNSELDQLREMVRRRGQREPWQYIVGEVEFSGIKLNCDPRALIPRPETEQLVEWLLEKQEHPGTVLDLGCGTGALGLALAQALPQIQVTLVDISEKALQLAGENVQKNGLENRVKLIHSDWFEEVQGKYDWIVSNPPYLTEEEWQSAEPEVQKYEPRNALYGGEQGLEPYKTILRFGRDFLQHGGLLAMETGVDMHDALFDLAEQFGWKNAHSVLDFHSRPRFFIANG